MEHRNIFSATLGLAHPWHLTAISFAREANHLELTVDFDLRTGFTCAHCGSLVQPSSSAAETWFHSDFHHNETYLHARVPVVECCGNRLPVERPWNRAGSKFARVESAILNS